MRSLMSSGFDMQLYLCFLLAGVTVSLAQEAPQLTILPTESVIRRDLGVTGFFTCRVSRQHEELIDDVVWLDPRGREVPSESRSRVHWNDVSSGKGRELVITEIAAEDSGNYTCKARYGTNQEISKSFTLRVYMSIRWEDAPQRQNPVTGRRAVIRCVVRADPPAIIEWIHDSDFIRSEGRYTVEKEGLVIENITSADDGVYVCRAKVPDEGEMDERAITVEVYSPPEITVPMPDQVVRVTEQEAGSIPCRASGKPAPRRAWLAPDGTDAGLVDGLTVNPRDGTLFIQPARRSMTGRYRCIATNDAGTAEIAVNVVVIVKPELVRYENMTSSAGESASLECRVSGSPLPTVAFRKAGTELQLEEGQFAGDGRITVQQSERDGDRVGVLTLRELTRHDDGLYECVATNEGGQMVETARLTVRYPPSLEDPPQPAVFTWIGQPANLSCRARAVPEATVSWRAAAGRSVDDPHLQEIGDGPLSVLRVTPVDASYYGTYTCTATNSLGSDSLDVELREATPPGPVEGVKLPEVTATTVRFDLPEPADDGGLPVVAYVVQYVLRGQPWSAAEQRVWPAGGNYTLGDLTPEQTYLFRFAAENAVGMGAWSEEEQTMPKVAAPQPPVISTEQDPAVAEQADRVVRSSQADSYALRWRPGADNGAQIDSYQISYYKVVNVKNKWRVVSAKRTSVVDAPGPLTFRLTQLKPESYYSIELRAHNRIGFGDPARLTVVTAADDATQESAPPPSLASGLVVGVVAGVLLVLLLLIDLTCYAVNNRGITHMLCSKARGTSGSAKLNDEAASEKEPLQENGNGNKSTPESNGERDVPDVTIDKAQLDSAKDSAV